MVRAGESNEEDMLRVSVAESLSFSIRALADGFFVSSTFTSVPNELKLVKAFCALTSLSSK